MKSKALRKIRELRGQIHFDLAPLNNVVFLAGSARSGTTWVQNVLNSNNDYRVLFEPFHNQKTNLITNWNNRLYLRPDNTDDKYLYPASRILNGKLRSPWVDKFNQKIFPKKRLIKDIRTNLSLKWLKTHFPDIKLVFLLRHPCAVVNSRMKLGWQDHLSDFLSQKELIDDFLIEHLDFINSHHDNFDKQIIMWCIENLVPLKQLNKNDALVVFYEELYESPERISKSLYDFLDLKISEKLAKTIANPSALTRKDSAVQTGKKVLNSWQEELSDKQKEKAKIILNQFGLDIIYDLGAKPKISSNEILALF